MPGGHVRVATVVSLALACTLLAVPAGAEPEDAGAAASVRVAYRWPADAPVLRGFDPPGTPYGPGHRGVDLDVAPGAPIHAAAAGRVTHAGPVAGTVWVAVAHADGVTTTYGPLAELRVTAGDAVADGQVLGVLAATGHAGPGHDDGGHEGLHWGARRGGAYLDPRSLLAGRPALVGEGSWQGSHPVVDAYAPWGGQQGWRLAPSPRATSPGWAIAPSAHHLIVVDGLATSSRSLPVDPSHLGYRPDSVTALSYAGRQLGADGGPWAADQLAYGPADTWAGVEAAALLLRDQLRAQRSAQPGRAVDLLGYSMGGVVMLYYLAHLHDPYDVTLPPIASVVTIASPHRGSDLAAAVRTLHRHAAIGPAIDLLAGLVPVGGGRSQRDVLPPGAPVVGQLATGSVLLDQLAQAWRDAVDAGTAGALATGTRLLTIGGSRDAVVAPRRAETLDAPWPEDLAEPHHLVLPGGHVGVLRTEAVREMVWRFLSGDDTLPATAGASAWLMDRVGTGMRAGAWLLTRAVPPHL